MQLPEQDPDTVKKQKPDVKAIHMIHASRISLDNSESDPKLTMENNFF